jgi:hypothetical protein
MNRARVRFTSVFTSVCARSALAAALVLAPLVGGCGAHFDLQTPDDFVELEDEHSGYAMRVTTANGIVIAVREIDNDPEGNVAFWVEAIKNRLRMNGGYALVEEREVTAASGQKGTQLRFGRDQNGTPFTYWLTLFAGEDHLHIVEAGGRQELFEPAEERIAQTVASITID